MFVLIFIYSQIIEWTSHSLKIRDAILQNKVADKPIKQVSSSTKHSRYQLEYWRLKCELDLEYSGYLLYKPIRFNDQ